MTKSKLIIIIFFTSVLSLQGQQIEEYRKKGFEAMQAGDLNNAIANYRAIIKLNPGDYDAKLALGRLYYRQNQCDSSMLFFREIYKSDKTDVEALNGFANCFNRKDMLDSAIFYAEKAISYLPDNIPQHLLLAKAFSYNGQVDKAIKIYHKANKIDSTWSEVWAGLGKMHYWKSQPFAAQRYYIKALALDPQNEQIKKAYQPIENELNYQVGLTGKYLEEVEETYRINAMIQRLDVQKRVSDRFITSAHVMLDYSQRDFENDVLDTTRWFDNSWVKLTFLTEKNHISAYCGASGSDNKFTSYGLTWRYRTSFKHIKVDNTFDAGYDYFYYWSNVGRHILSDKLKIQYKPFTLNVSINSGIIDDKPVKELPSDVPETKQNPFYSYNLQCKYKVLARPEIQIGVNHSYLDYKYISTEYYTPNDRFLTGPVASVYYKYKLFYIYAMYSYQFGNEKFYYLGDNNQKESGSIEIDNWSASADMGINLKSSSISAGISRFVNPYYENLLGFIKATITF